MRFLKLYGGVILILLTVIALYVSFTSDIEKATYNWVLIGCAVAIILGVVLCVLGGKSADKIGGK
ncbi:MAG: hypothetical protein K6E73_10980 [Bacteroidales bacterium]|jgi:heme/copper-type cytochrome/quinol oxidase subunit 4|nr:hypothetical protein [Bacteroidales bacterium]